MKDGYKAFTFSPTYYSFALDFDSWDISNVADLEPHQYGQWPKKEDIWLTKNYTLMK